MWNSSASRILPIPLFCFAASLAAATNPPLVTFSKDVAPILQKSCQSCHRSGEAAPMQLLTFEQTRPWAKAIREAVLTRRMPPWFADPGHGAFSNDRRLSQREIDTLAAWADNGAPEGNPRDLPKPANFVEGWSIGQPDAVFEMANEFEIPASGAVEYRYVVVRGAFDEDKWVQMAEIRPGNRSAVHHAIAFVRPPTSRWLKDLPPGVFSLAPKPTAAQKDPSSESNGEFLVGYTPGFVPLTLRPGQGKLVKAGSDIVFEIHYTTNGKPARDRTRVGIVFAKETPSERIYSLIAKNRDFVIPAGAPNHEIDSELTFDADVSLVSLMPHMHLRGKDFEYQAVYPSGERETLLRVPRYTFSWQLTYRLEKPKLLPKGTRIECSAHFDNSPNNPNNPDPTKEVHYGQQSWDEMMSGWMDVAFDAKLDPRRIARARQTPERAAP